MVSNSANGGYDDLLDMVDFESDNDNDKSSNALRKSDLQHSQS